MKILKQLALLATLFNLSSGYCSNDIKEDKTIELPKLNWENKDGKKIPSIEIKKLRGKVIYMHFFQSWCPGCLSKGLPAISQLSKKYNKNEKVKFFAIQTVFEGFQINTKSKLKRIREKFDLDFPMAQDDGDGKGSLVMKTFKTRGTPWLIIIDQLGKVVVSEFHIPPTKSKLIIDKLLLTK